MNVYILVALLAVTVSASPFYRAESQGTEEDPIKQLERMAHVQDQYHLVEKPNLSLQSNMTDLVLKAGDALDLYCNTVSTPQSNVFWTLNGRLVQGTRRRSFMERIVNHDNMMIATGIAHSHFHSPCVDSSFNGKFTCFASNGFTMEKKTITVTVEGSKMCEKPVIRAPHVTLWTDARYENIGNSVILMCRRNVAMAETVWYNEERKAINDAQGYHVLPNGDLYIPVLKWEMMGNYYCSVRNEVGEERVESFLYPTDPNAPSTFDEEETEDQAFSL